MWGHRNPGWNVPEKRLLLLYEAINELLLLHPPDIGAVEKLFFQRNVTTAIAVGQARGVLLLALAKAGIRVSGIQSYGYQAGCGRLRRRRQKPGSADGEDIITPG
jgi:hypothetical protein